MPRACEALTICQLTIAEAAEFYSGEEVPHFYGTLDFMYDSEQPYIGDANSRGPRVPEASHAARKGLISHIGSKALQVLDRVG
ncbi:MAG TPA: hypothetical protein VLA92_01105 [Candidatus Saccharimonadales bacterium]|nr:hypothetical protein [Candidatus Saccharimonadales bacterium]